ncbi:MAG: helix-turn-helix domain-containing protein [Dehalococcoidia bacterium]
MKDGQGRSKRTERIFYTFNETMDQLAFSKHMLRKLMKSGLTSHRIGRKIVFLKEDVAEWKRAH